MLRLSIVALAIVVAAPAFADDFFLPPNGEFAAQQRHNQMMMYQQLEAADANTRGAMQEIDNDLTHYYMRNPPKRGVGF